MLPYISLFSLGFGAILQGGKQHHKNTEDCKPNFLFTLHDWVKYCLLFSCMRSKVEAL